jgi:hypothetical protein
MLDYAGNQGSVEREVAVEDELYHGFDVQFVLLRRQHDLQVLGQESLESITIFPHCMGEYLVDGLKDELHEGSLTEGSGGFPRELPILRVVVEISP